MTWLQEFAKYWDEYLTTDLQSLDPEYVTYDMHGYPEKSAWGFMRWLADKAEEPESDDGNDLWDEDQLQAASRKHKVGLPPIESRPPAPNLPQEDQ